MLTPADISALELSQPHEFSLPDEDATAALGALVAAQLKTGDVIYLHGDLGAGKSTLARGLIRALTHPNLDVPSPTFTLMQAYEAPDFDILHLDLYRIETPQETLELGLDEAQASAVLLIEWPQRLGHLGFDARLDIILERAMNNGEGRIAKLLPAAQFR